MSWSSWSALRRLVIEHFKGKIEVILREELECIVEHEGYSFAQELDQLFSSINTSSAGAMELDELLKGIDHEELLAQMESDGAPHEETPESAQQLCKELKRLDPRDIRWKRAFAELLRKFATKKVSADVCCEAIKIVHDPDGQRSLVDLLLSFPESQLTVCALEDISQALNANPKQQNRIESLLKRVVKSHESAQPKGEVLSKATTALERRLQEEIAELRQTYLHAVADHADEMIATQQRFENQIEEFKQTLLDKEIEIQQLQEALRGSNADNGTTDSGNLSRRQDAFMQPAMTREPAGGTAVHFKGKDGECIRSFSPPDKELKQELEKTGKNGIVTCVAVCGDVVGSAYDTHVVRIWDLSSGTCIDKYFHEDSVQAIVITCDQRFAISGSERRQQACIVRNFLAKRSVRIVHQQHSVTSMAITMNHLAVASNKFVNVYSVDSLIDSQTSNIREEIPSTVYRHSDSIKGVAISAEHLAIACKDQKVCAWSLAAGPAKPLHTFKHSAHVNDVEINKDMVASASADMTIGIWSLVTGEQIHRFAPNMARSLYTVSLTNEIVAAGGALRGVIGVFSLHAGKELHTLKDPDEGFIQCIRVSGELIVVGDSKGGTKVWYVRSILACFQAALEQCTSTSANMKQLLEHSFPDKPVGPMSLPEAGAFRLDAVLANIEQYHELLSEQKDAAQMISAALKRVLQYTQSFVAKGTESWSTEDIETSQMARFDTFEEAYDGVHNVLKLEESYQTVTALCEELSQCVAKYDECIDRVEDVGEKLVILYIRAAAARKLFADLCHSITSETIFFHLAPLKGIARVCEKMSLRPNGGVPWDIVRGQLVCSSMKDIAKVLQTLKQRKVQMVAVNDRFKNSKGGWADVSVYLCFPEYPGVVAELQIVAHHLLYVRENMKAHDAYDETRFGAEILRVKTQKITSGVPWSQQP